MIKTFAQVVMSAEADAVCGAAYGQRSDERVNSRNGYRAREWDTRAGTIDLAIPKLRQGSYFPDWLLTHRRRAEQALVSVVATSYLLGVSTWRVEKLVEQLGIRQLSKSQVSEMAAHLDAQVEAFRNRPLDSGHYTFVWMDALTMKVREAVRTVNVHALIAVGVNADGQREVLGLDVAADNVTPVRRRACVARSDHPTFRADGAASRATAVAVSARPRRIKMIREWPFGPRAVGDGWCRIRRRLNRRRNAGRGDETARW
ncbi:hypothetical protein GCM10027605_01700 [Micromonospora zhanjiangensis]